MLTVKRGVVILVTVCAVSLTDASGHEDGDWATVGVAILVTAIAFESIARSARSLDVSRVRICIRVRGFYRDCCLCVGCGGVSETKEGTALHFACSRELGNAALVTSARFSLT